MKQVEQRQTAPMSAVRKKYCALFGEEPRSTHKELLFRRIAWRIQAESEGGLSERARQRALSIAWDADLLILPPRGPSNAAMLKQRPHGPPNPAAGLCVETRFPGAQHRGQRSRR